MENDDDIDLLREYIRDRSVELMASKHPMIKDLRYIYVLSDISTELEKNRRLCSKYMQKKL